MGSRSVTPYLIAAVVGGGLWLATGYLAGRREAWDAAEYWMMAYPAGLVVSAAVGYFAPARSPWGFGLALMEGASSYQPVAKLPDSRMRRVHHDTTFLAPPSDAHVHNHLITRVDDLQSLDLPLVENLHLMPQYRFDLCPASVDADHLGPHRVPLVQLRVFGEGFERCFSVSHGPRLMDAPHDLHVLLRHRLRSIPQPQESA